MNTTVFDVVHMFSEGGISAVPIIDEDGIVVNLYETVDVIVSHVSMAVLYAVLQEVNHLYHRPSYDSVSTRDRKSTRLNSSHSGESRMPSSA